MTKKTTRSKLAKTRPQAKKRHPKHRASWSGQLRFGLVSFGVQAFNAHLSEAGEFHFHQLHVDCHSRIRYLKTCPIHGEVDNDEVVSGYEYRKGKKYVEIDPEELDALRTESERALTIDAFISPSQLDAIYYDGRRYLLVPDSASSAEPYAVLAQAMRNQGRDGVGQVVFSGREQLARLRAVEGVLVMSMLDYSAEVKKPEAMAAELPSKRLSSRNVELAEALVSEWSKKKFDFDDYQDRYRAKVKELIDAKIEGREVVVPEPEQPPEVINLVDALKKSLAWRESQRSERASRSRRRRSGRRAS
ncbi:MAG TPA: Ku protein [Pirellulales bacterium]|nr:Ku protein [Pirellulales bacterium]